MCHCCLLRLIETASTSSRFDLAKNFCHLVVSFLSCYRAVTLPPSLLVALLLPVLSFPAFAQLSNKHLSLPLTLPYLTLPYLTLPYLTLPYLTVTLPSPYLTLPYLTFPYLTLPYLTLPSLPLPYLTLPYLTLPYLPFPSLTLP